MTPSYNLNASKYTRSSHEILTVTLPVGKSVLVASIVSAASAFIALLVVGVLTFRKCYKMTIMQLLLSLLTTDMKIPSSMNQFWMIMIMPIKA